MTLPDLFFGGLPRRRFIGSSGAIDQVSIAFSNGQRYPVHLPPADKGSPKPPSRYPGVSGDLLLFTPLGVVTEGCASVAGVCTGVESTRGISQI